MLDFGLSNQDIGVLYAQVNGDGTLASSSGGVTSASLGTGQYSVDFGRNVSACAFVATIGSSGTVVNTGMVSVSDRAGNSEAVYVRTLNTAGVITDNAFQLVVVC